MADKTEGREIIVLDNSEEEVEVKWLKYYSSDHQILLVGDGDFSFSLSLSNCFASASNIVATSLDSYDVLVKKYSDAKSNLESLKKLGATLIHGVDATKMRLHTDLKMRKFDRIVYNFPHAGFYGKEDHGHLIKMHRKLVKGFFRNASGMLRPYGEVHVNHKTTAPFNHWNLEELASNHHLGLIECVDFKKEDYPGYNNKRGDGSRCDEPFPLGECSTFKFKFKFMKKKKQQPIPDIFHKQTGTVPETRIYVEYPVSFSMEYPRAFHPLDMHPVYQTMPKTHILDQYPGSFGIEYPRPVPPPSLHPELHTVPETHIRDRYPGSFSTEYPRAVHPLNMRPEIQTSLETHIRDWYPGSLRNAYPQAVPLLNMHPEIRRNVDLPLVNTASTECLTLFTDYFRNAEKMFGRTDYDVRRVTEDTLRAGLNRYMLGDPERDMNGYITHLEELHRISQSRVELLRSLLAPRYI